MLKPAVTSALLDLLEPIQKAFRESKDWQDIEQKAYPPEQAKKKEKKVKNLGTRFPNGGNQVGTKADGHNKGPSKDEIDLINGVSNLDTIGSL